MNLIPLIDESRLVTLIDDPAAMFGRWRESAGCADLARSGEPSFRDDGQLPSGEALARCITCPVAHECLATALVHESEVVLRFGWWGGCGPEARELLADRIGLATQHV